MSVNEDQRMAIEASVASLEQALALLDVIIADYQGRRAAAGDNLAALRAKLGLAGKTSPVSVN